jgi:hypothetical protein
MPAAAYRTFQIAAPLSTHFVPARCDQVDCPEYLNGWVTAVDESTDLGQAQAHYIRHDRERRHFEQRRPDGLTEFRFPAGQRCFRSGDHKRRLEREEIFVMRDGDHRGNPLGTSPVKVGATSWVDAFGEHQEKLADEFGKG